MKNGKRVVLEVLSKGKKLLSLLVYTLIQKPYTWTKTPLLDVDIKELPKFPLC